MYFGAVYIGDPDLLRCSVMGFMDGEGQIPDFL